MATVVDLIVTLKGVEVPPGVTLQKALAKAHAHPGTCFVHQWRGVEGWHATNCIPTVKTFFKVSHGKIYACFQLSRPNYSERLVGHFEGDQIQMKDIV